MRPLQQPRLLWFVLLPAALLLVGVWVAGNILRGQAATLGREAAVLDAERMRHDAPADPALIARIRDRFTSETAELLAIAREAGSLGSDDLVSSHEGVPFQLIDFERERAAALQKVREQAGDSGTRVEDSAFDVLADASGTVANPRHRWAQLAVARAAASRAVSAGVRSYSALTVPAVREFRTTPAAAVLVEQVLFAAEVKGDSASVQQFIELLALGPEPGSIRFVIEHLVLRKDGVSAPDQVSATVVFGGLLAPAPEPSPLQP